MESVGGVKVSETELGWQLSDKSLGKVCLSTRKVLKPNEAVSDEFAIHELYRMDLPGKYAIQVQREIPSWMGSKGTIKSNASTVTVTPQNLQPKNGRLWFPWTASVQVDV